MVLRTVLSVQVGLRSRLGDGRNAAATNVWPGTRADAADVVRALRAAVPARRCASCTSAVLLRTRPAAAVKEDGSAASAVASAAPAINRCAGTPGAPGL